MADPALSLLAGELLGRPALIGEQCLTTLVWAIQAERDREAEAEKEGRRLPALPRRPKTQNPLYPDNRVGTQSFRPDGQGRNIAGLVDFLAPHNYSGGAQAIISDLRVGAGYRGAVALEEFGFPTDPHPRDPSWTEGPRQCWANPLQGACAATAPFFVEANLRSLRTGSYAGGLYGLALLGLIAAIVCALFLHIPAPRTSEAVAAPAE